MFKLSTYISAEGRINRRTWWGAVALMNAMFIAALVAGYKIFGTSKIEAFLMLFLPLELLLIGAFLTTSIKRLHDLNYSGWLAFLTLVPLINLAMVFILGFKRGTEGLNKYGAAP